MGKGYSPSTIDRLLEVIRRIAEKEGGYYNSEYAKRTTSRFTGLSCITIKQLPTFAEIIPFSVPRKARKDGGGEGSEK